MRCQNTLTWAESIEFVRWADSFSRPITVQDVTARFEVSRATAYRMLQAYRDVPGGKPVAVRCKDEPGARGHAGAQLVSVHA